MGTGVAADAGLFLQIVFNYPLKQGREDEAPMIRSISQRDAVEIFEDFWQRRAQRIAEYHGVIEVSEKKLDSFRR